MILSLLRPLWWMKVKFINMLFVIWKDSSKSLIFTSRLSHSFSQSGKLPFWHGFSRAALATQRGSRLPTEIFHISFFTASLFFSSYCFIHSFSLSSILTLLAMQLKGTMMNCSKRFDKTYILRHFLCYNICWLWLSASQCNARKSHNCSFTLPLSPAICNKQTSDAFTM